MFTERDLIGEMVEAGVDFDLAQLFASLVTPLKNDPRGFRAACMEDEPVLAAFLGYRRLH